MVKERVTNEERSRALVLKQLTCLAISMYLSVHCSPKNVVRSFELLVKDQSLFKLSEKTKVLLLWEPN